MLILTCTVSRVHACSLELHCHLYGFLYFCINLLSYDFLLIIQTLNAFFLGTFTDITSQMTALHAETDWPYATSTAEVRELQSSETQPSETQPSETLPVVARKQSK